MITRHIECTLLIRSFLRSISPSPAITLVRRTVREEIPRFRGQHSQSQIYSIVCLFVREEVEINENFLPEFFSFYVVNRKENKNKN